MHRQPKKQQSRHELIHGHLRDEQTCPSPTTIHPAKFNRCGVARNTKNQSYCRWPNNKPPCSHHTTRQPSRRNKNRIIYKSSTNDPHNNPINLSLNELHAHAIRFRTQLKFGLRCLKFAALSNNFYLQKSKRNSSNAKFYDFLLRAHIYKLWAFGHSLSHYIPNHAKNAMSSSHIWVPKRTRKFSWLGPHVQILDTFGIKKIVIILVFTLQYCAPHKKHQPPDIFEKE